MYISLALSTDSQPACQASSGLTDLDSPAPWSRDQHNECDAWTQARIKNTDPRPDRSREDCSSRRSLVCGRVAIFGNDQQSFMLSGCAIASYIQTPRCLSWPRVSAGCESQYTKPGAHLQSENVSAILGTQEIARAGSVAEIVHERNRLETHSVRVVLGILPCRGLIDLWWCFASEQSW